MDKEILIYLFNYKENDINLAIVDTVAMAIKAAGADIIDTINLSDAAFACYKNNESTAKIIKSMSTTPYGTFYLDYYEYNKDPRKSNAAWIRAHNGETAAIRHIRRNEERATPNQERDIYYQQVIPAAADMIAEIIKGIKQGKIAKLPNYCETEHNE